MLGIALALAASFAHAGWNAAAKTVADGGMSALWAYSMTSVVLLTPFALIAMALTSAQLPAIVFAVAPVSSILHTAYGALLQEAYRHFDVSQVYPLSRGLAPVLIGLAAAVTLGQHLNAWQWGAIALMGVAVAAPLIDAGAATADTLSGSSLVWAGAIAVAVAAYTLWDGWAIVELGLDPIPYYWISALVQVAFMTVLIRGRFREGLHQARTRTRPVVAIALLIPTSYLLALFANQHAPVSLVAAVRSSSVVWVTVAAVVFLHEPLRRARVISVTAALLAIIAMAL